MNSFILIIEYSIKEDINMFIKIRRDTLIILLLAFILILCGRLIIYVAYASSAEVEEGVPIAGIIVKGN